jgi:hypothetical protein
MWRSFIRRRRKSDKDERAIAVCVYAGWGNGRWKYLWRFLPGFQRYEVGGRLISNDADEKPHGPRGCQGFVPPSRAAMGAAVQRAFLAHGLWAGTVGLQSGGVKDWATELRAVICNSELCGRKVAPQGVALHVTVTRRRTAMYLCGNYIPEAELAAMVSGDVLSAADHVRSQRYRVRHSDVDFLRDFDRVIDLDPEVANGALDLRMSKQKLYCPEVPVRL